MQQQYPSLQPILRNVPDRDDPQRHLMAPSIHSHDSHGPGYATSQDSHASHAVPPGLGLTGAQSRSLDFNTRRVDPFSDYHRYIATGDTRIQGPATPGTAEAIGLAFTKDYEVPERVNPQKDATRTNGRSPSPTPSTPSIYPPSLPPVPEKDEDYLFYERQTQRKLPNDPLPIPPKAVTADVKPSNPFVSPLDIRPQGKKPSSSGGSSVQTNQSYRPLTPPDSAPGHSPMVATFAEKQDDPTKTPNPFANSFLGRPYSAKPQLTPIPRPERNPLRLSTSEATLRRA